MVTTPSFSIINELIALNLCSFSSILKPPILHFALVQERRKGNHLEKGTFRNLSCPESWNVVWLPIAFLCPIDLHFPIWWSHLHRKGKWPENYDYSWCLLCLAFEITKHHGVFAEHVYLKPYNSHFLLAIPFRFNFIYIFFILINLLILKINSFSNSVDMFWIKF